MDGKTVKISASLDEASFSRVKQKISEVTAEVKKLSDATKGIDLGGLFGGVGNKKKIAGTGSSSVKGPVPGGGGSPIAMGGLDNLTKGASAFKQAGDSAKSALRGMSDAFKEHVGVSTRESRKLLQEIQELEKGFERVGRKARKMAGGGRSGGGGGSDDGGFSFDERRSLRGGARRGFDSFGEFGNSPIPGTPRMPGSKNSFLAKALGITGGIGLGVLGGVTSVAAGINFASEQRNSNQMANANYQASHLPFLGASRAATAGQIFGGNALALKQGDLARAHALKGLGTEKNFLSLVGDKRMDLQKFAIDKANSTSFAQNPTFGGAASQFKSWLGGSSARMMNFLSGEESPGLGTESENKLKNEIQKSFVASRGAEDIGKMIDLKMQQDPVNNGLLNSVWGGAGGNLALSRSAGISGGLRWRPNARSGQMQQYDTVSDFESRSLRSGFGGGEIAGQMMQTLGASGRRGGVGGAASLINAGYGGLSNATALYGHGAQFGAGGFYSGFQHLLGRGGVGGVAGASIGGTAMAAMNGGNFTGFSGSGVGLGLSGVLADATMSGDPGTDIRRARQVAGGLGAMGNIASGGLDPLQQALNYSSAMKAMPGGGFGQKKALMDMDPATRMEILRTGKMPSWMTESGVEFKDVQAYSNAQGASGLSRISNSMVSGTNLQGTLDNYRKAGGVDYMKDMKGKDRETEITRLGRLFNMSGMGSLDDTEGMVRLALGERGIGRRAKGGGVGAGLDKGSNSMQVLRAEASIKAGEGQSLVDQKDAIADLIPQVPGMSKGMDRSRQIAQAGANGSPEEAIASLQVALNNFVNSLRQLPNQIQGPIRAKPPMPR